MTKEPPAPCTDRATTDTCGRPCVLRGIAIVAVFSLLGMTTVSARTSHSGRLSRKTSDGEHDVRNVIGYATSPDGVNGTQQRDSTTVHVAGTPAEAQPSAAQMGPGRRVIAADDSTRTLAAVGADGRIEWKMPCRQIHDLQLLPDGHLLYQDGWTRIIELDATRKPVWQYDAKENGNASRPVEVHAFQRLSDGSTMIVESGPARIIEVDRTGTIMREIPLTVDSPSAHSDTRNARKTPAGTYLVAHENDGVVREYDVTGKVVWDFDVPLFDTPRKAGHGPEAFGDQVYSAERLPNGNTLVGTGNGHSVIEVTPDREIAWKLGQNDLPGITLAWVTQVRRLPSGNTLLVNCHAGPGNPQIIEVTPEKKVVWTFKDFNTFGNSLPVALVLDP